MHPSRYLSDPALGEFVLVEERGARALVRHGYEPVLSGLGLEGLPTEVPVVGGGRARHPLIQLPGGERVVVRGYRRGGLMRHVNRERYFFGDRALEELRATERARAAGVRVPHVLAAVQRRAPVGYTATLATRWIEGAEELVEWLRGQEHGGAARVLRAAGAQIARLHAAGIVHPDLNLRNILVAGAEVYLIDFDRARVLARPVSRGARARGLLRLARSARKLRAAVDPAGWAAFREGYGAGWPLRRPLG